MPWFYYIVVPIVKTLLFLFSRWQIKGRENIPSQGPVLVISNHLSFADIPLLGVSLGRRLIFMAKKELFHFRFIGYLVGGLGSFPVHRGRLDRKALSQAERVLAEGLALVMFPEASRSKNAQLKPAFPGSALVALRSGAPILPVAITGTEKIKNAAWQLRRPQITVNIGHPFHLPPVNGKSSKTELAELTNIIMGHIAELLPVEYRGNYAEKEN